MNLKKLTTLLFAGVTAATPFATNAQNPTILQGNYISNVFGQANFVLNPNAQTNVANVTLTNATATRSTTTPLVATSEWNVTVTSANGTITWATRSFDEGMKNQNCEARFSYRGFQATSKAQIKQGANVVAELVLTPSATDPRIASINFPCGDLSSATTFVITDTATLSGTNEIGGIYVGLATNQANVAQAEIVGITEINNCGTDHVGTASTSFSAYASVGSCNIVNSFKATTVNKDLSITIPNADPGVYYINFNGIPFHNGNNTSLCYWAIKEDTSGYISGGSYQASGSTLTSRGASQLSAYYNATTRATRTWRIVSKNNSGTGSICNVGARAFETPSTLITVSRFPSSSELVVTPETQNVWGGVNYYRSSSAIPIRGGQPASTTFETFNSSAWNTGKTLKGKCEAPTTGSGNDIGCSIANMPVGSYRIHASGLMYESLSTNGVTTCSYQIYETTTSTQVGVITNLTLKPDGGIIFNGRSVDGVFANNSLGTRNFVIRGAKTNDTTTGSASTCRLFVSQGTSEISDFNITIEPLDNNANSALYVQGPVKAAATGTAIQEPYQGFLGGTQRTITDAFTYSDRSTVIPTTGATYSLSTRLTLNAGLYWCSFNSSVSAATDTSWYSKVTVNGTTAGLNLSSHDLITGVRAGYYTNKQVSIPIYLTTQKTVEWRHAMSTANANAAFHEMWCMKVN